MAKNGGPPLPHGTDTDLFASASAAAAEGRPEEMLSALSASGFMDGLARILRKRWPVLPATAIDEYIATSVDAAYDAIRKGKPVRNLGAWLWKVADKIARDQWAEDYRRRGGSVEDLPDTADRSLTDEDRLEADELAEFRRGEAIRFARQLLPRLGQGQIIDVMSILIDAVEQGEPDLPTEEVADALAISVGAARSLISRGLSRLRREAAKEGIDFPSSIADPGDDPEDADNKDEQ